MNAPATVAMIGAPTFSIEAEHAVLGALMVDALAGPMVDAAGLTAAAFHDDSHSLIYATMHQLRQRGVGVDLVTVFEALQSRGQADRCGGLPYLNELCNAAPHGARVGAHAAIIVEKARRRAVEALGVAVQRAALDPASGDEWRARIDALARDLSRLGVPAHLKPRIPLEWASDLPEELHAPPQIVEGVLTAGGMSTVFGESNSGKSYLAIHLAICVSLGLPWLGRRTRKGAVLYVAAEGAWSIRLRLAAYRKHHGHSAGRFGLIPCALSLLDPSADVESLIELLKAKADELGEPILLVVIDTVARVMGGGDENAAQDMGRLVSAGDRIREETGAHLLYIHHAGKDASRGARGHSSLRAALDTEIEVTADESNGVHSAKVTKQRDLPSKGEKFAARFVPVDLGVDQWDNPITAGAVVDTEAESTDRPRRMTAAQQAVLGYLAGRDRGTTRRDVVDAMIPQGISRPSVYRAINDLLSTGLVVFTAGQLYVPKA